MVFFGWFVMQLIPALADSLVGRTAPIHQWWITEGLISTLIAPMLGLTVALIYLALVDEYGAAAPTPQRKVERGLSIMIHPAKGAEPWRAPKGSPRAERVRERPIGLEKDRLRPIQWRLLWVALSGFGFAVAVPLIFALGVGVADHGDAVGQVLMASMLVSMAWILDVGLIPITRQIAVRAEAGVPIEAEVSRVVAYRPSVLHLALRLQILRYTVADGTVLEACSQIRDVTLVPGQVVSARYDPADPQWVSIEKDLDEQLRRITLFSRGLMLFAAGLLLIGLLGSVI